MTRPLVHVTGRVPEAISERLLTDFELIATPDGADGILSLLTTQIDADFLARAGANVKVVANYAVGVNNIDLAAARERGIVIANTPDVLTRATAELAVGLMLSLMRRITEGDRLLRSHSRWEFHLEFMLGESLDGKLVGIIGPGRIGTMTAQLVEAFGARTIFAGRDDPLAHEELLGTADVVSLHCPLTPQTHHLIDGPALARMQRTAILVNTARGPIVDERALVRALQAGTIAGAALDVYEFEPDVTDELLGFENVVLSPHLGSATRETREAMGMLAVEALRAVLLEGREPPNAVSP